MGKDREVGNLNTDNYFDLGNCTGLWDHILLGLLCKMSPEGQIGDQQVKCDQKLGRVFLNTWSTYARLQGKRA